MGKSKKSKKDVDVDENSDNESTQQPPQENSDDEQKVSKKSSKKSKKDKKKADVSDESENEQPEAQKPAPPKEVKTKKELKREKKQARNNESDDGEQLPSQPISAFALLQDDSDSDGGNDAASGGHIKSEDEEEKKPKSKKKNKKNKPEPSNDGDDQPATGGKKQKKKKTKRGDSDEEDLDKMLAELQLEYAGEKKVEPVKTSKPVEQPAVVEKSEPEPATSKKSKKKKKAGTEEVSIAPMEVTPVVPETKIETPTEVPVAEDSGAAAKKKKGPGKAMVAAMQEALKKKKEDEDRFQREEEERIRILEENDRMKQEKARLEQERKERKKLKEKERKERLKAEGKLLSNKQKADKARAAAMIESLKAQGVEVAGLAEKRARPGTRIRPSKQKKELETAPEPETKPVEQPVPIISPEKTSEEPKPETTESEVTEIEPAPVEEIKDAWDVSSSSEEEDEEDEDEETPPPEPTAKKTDAKKTQPPAAKKQESVEVSESEESESSEESSDEESSSEEEEDHRTEAEKMRERAEIRIRKRESEAEKKRTLENLRAAVVCVLGHVDTGKTKILDKLRRTNVQDGEAGGITQQIGATNVPIDAIKENTRHCKGGLDFVFKLPGLLIIDTPGHESFSNLRSRGSSLCDIAILVVDIMHGLEPQTIESLNLLKQRKTPFVVALNKIDRLYDWKPMPRKDVQDIIKGQALNTQQEFQKRLSEVVLQFNEQGMNAALFYDNPDPRSYISLVPTSAISGEGMGNLLMLIVQFSQNQLAKRLMYSETLQATVLEVKVIPGLGTTIDTILINGKLREGDTMILAGTDGPVVTQIKALLMPQPMKELRVKSAYVEHKEILAAQGVKIAAKELEKAIAGINLQIAQKADEVEIYKEIVAKDLKSVLRSIKLSDQGVFVQASTLGSLEALLEFLKTSKIPYAGIRIGPVVKRDVVKASIMLEHHPEYATILAFDVKIERDAEEMAGSLGVKIFHADIIYHLFDKFTAYREELKQSKRDQFKSVAVFPCKLRVLPQCVFNSRDPIVCGVMVEAGIVKEGTPICVPSKEFVELGVVTSIENNHKNVESARKGQEVCIKIEPASGDAPKMFGRHFDETDMLVSKISRQSIDACKDYFRDDLLKSDWTLMVELKKAFQIL